MGFGRGMTVIAARSCESFIRSETSVYSASRACHSLHFLCSFSPFLLPSPTLSISRTLSAASLPSFVFHRFCRPFLSLRLTFLDRFELYLTQIFTPKVIFDLSNFRPSKNRLENSSIFVEILNSARIWPEYVELCSADFTPLQGCRCKRICKGFFLRFFACEIVKNLSIYGHFRLIIGVLLDLGGGDVYCERELAREGKGRKRV